MQGAAACFSLAQAPDGAHVEDQVQQVDVRELRAEHLHCRRLSFAAC